MFCMHYLHDTAIPSVSVRGSLPRFLCVLKASFFLSNVLGLAVTIGEVVGAPSLAEDRNSLGAKLGELAGIMRPTIGIACVTD